MKNKKIIILGAGGHGMVVASILIANDSKVFGFYDDDVSKIGKEILGVPVLGKISDLESDMSIMAIVGVGKNKIRKALVKKFQFDWINAIHPFSWVSPDVALGKGTVICAGSIVQPGSRIGDHVIINTKSSIDHECRVANYCHVAVAHLAGAASIEEGVFVALNSTVLPLVNVGEWSIVGAGAVVTKNVLPNQIVVGVPAKPINKS